MENLELIIEQMKRLFICSDKLKEISYELEQFLEDTNMNNIKFAKDVMLSEEIKSNNLVEGYLDDVNYIEEVKNKHKANNDKEQRIINLYNGYKYILKGKNINKDNLKKLYSLLSKNLLSMEDLNNMGKYYREDDVYIHFSKVLTVSPDKGLDYNLIEEYMNKLFDYINKNNDLTNKTDYFIKSQIIHYYFVYIHPYFDVNGRTSRTISMWYLLNNKIYPYIIFNRGINFDKNTYYKAIRETKKYGNLTIFLKYMLETVKIELEKEYLINNIEKQGLKLSLSDKQVLNYILSMNGDINLKTFNSFYNKFNERKSIREINNNLLEPLFYKDILVKNRNTSSKIYDGSNNYEFSIKDNLIIKDPNKIKRLKI